MVTNYFVWFCAQTATESYEQTIYSKPRVLENSDITTRILIYLTVLSAQMVEIRWHILAYNSRRSHKLWMFRAIGYPWFIVYRIDRDGNAHPTYPKSDTSDDTSRKFYHLYERMCPFEIRYSNPTYLRFIMFCWAMIRKILWDFSHI